MQGDHCLVSVEGVEHHCPSVVADAVLWLAHVVAGLVVHRDGAAVPLLAHVVVPVSVTPAELRRTLDDCPKRTDFQLLQRASSRWAVVEPRSWAVEQAE